MDSGAKKILDNLKSRKYEPVYVLQGEETYYIDLISNYIESNVLTDAERGFNQVIVYGKDVTVSAILTHARRFPMTNTCQAFPYDGRTAGGDSKRSSGYCGFTEGRRG